MLIPMMNRQSRGCCILVSELAGWGRLFLQAKGKDKA
jgi:hypothetical protein